MYNIILLHEGIHPAHNLFLAMYLAHLLTDFVFQTSRIVANKHRGKWRGYIVHGVTHYVAVLVIVTLADPHRLPTLSFQLLAVSLSVVHLLVDWAKVSFTTSNRMPDNAVAFILDQAIHLVTVIGAVFLLVHPSLDTLVLWLNRIRLHQESILLVSVIYVLVIFGGGYFIRALIGPLWKEEEGQNKAPKTSAAKR
jgi:glucan phosphoethanolaminetransferase (alkaline phosphatase superfamily)